MSAQCHGGQLVAPGEDPAGGPDDRLDMSANTVRISFFGGLPKDDPIIRLDSNLVHYREISIFGANGSSPDHDRRALELISTGAVPVSDLITERMGLSDVHRAIGTVASGTATKVTVEP